MLIEYLPLAVLMSLGALTAGALLLLSRLLGSKRPNPVKLSAYECGVTHMDERRKPTLVRFYMVAMMFIIFDVEAAFLYPWTTVMDDLLPKLVGFAEVAVFLGVLLLGFAWIWKKGALEWE